MPDVTGVLAQMRRHISELGERCTGPAEVMRHWDLSTVVRQSSSAGPLWYKAVPELFAAEGPVTAWLSGHAPGAVPRVIGAGSGWLLMREIARSNAGETGSPVTALAELQCALTERAEDARQSCVASRPLDTFPRALRGLAERTDLPGAARAVLAGALPTFEAVTERALELEVPDTVVHGDFQRGNTAWTTGGWCVIDWTDAYVGFPFVDLAQPLADGDRSARDAYVGPWRRLLGARRAAEAAAVAPVLGAGAHLLMHERLVDVFPANSQLRRSFVLWCSRLSVAVAEWTTGGRE